MEFRKVIVLQMIFLGISTFKGSVADRSPVLQCTCASVVPEICGPRYNRTIFPNKVNKFSSQTDALKEFGSFPIQTLSRQNCSSMLITFLCSYHFPPCLKDLECEGVGPCDTLCAQVRAGCEPLLLEHNYTWPDHFNCSKFPTLKDADPYCIPSTSLITVAVESCVQVKQPICAALHSKYMTKFPNKDLITQTEADIQFNTFVPALSSNCSSMLKVFLCTSHYPICMNGSIQIYPCRHMCEQVRQSCEPFLLQQNQSWPKFLNCSSFPNKNDTSACVDRDSIFNAPSTPTPKTATLPPMSSQDTCEPILPEVLEICGGIHPNYTTTHFPYGHFASQRQAIETLKNSTEYLAYLELIDENCAAEIKPFLCLHFFPMCSPTQPITIVKPCRNVCRRATKGCSACVNKWPFDCDDYKVKGTCLNLDDLKQYKHRFPKETKC